MSDDKESWMHPHSGADISPFFGTHYHKDRNSKVAQFCAATGISIHDRVEAYEQMKLIEIQPKP